MQDQPVQPMAGNQTDPSDQSYVDAYDQSTMGEPAVPAAPPEPQSQPDQQSQPNPPVQPQPEPQLQTQPNPQSQPQPATQTSSEALEDQNIFYLLGVETGTDEQKETFLDELQQVIWEDFLENDVQLLLTKEESEQLQQMVGGNTKKPLSEQEEVVVFLEKLIPDLEEIMLEKALELKADLVKERIAGLRELYAQDQNKLEQLNQADSLVGQNQWLSAARTLNEIT